LAVLKIELNNFQASNIKKKDKNDPTAGNCIAGLGVVDPPAVAMAARRLRLLPLPAAAAAPVPSFPPSAIDEGSSLNAVSGSIETVRFLGCSSLVHLKRGKNVKKCG
jgi:hypothetical protein